MQKQTETKNNLINVAISYVQDGLLNTQYSTLQQLRNQVVLFTEEEQTEIENAVRWSQLPQSVNWVGNPFDKWQRNFLVGSATGIALGGANYKVNGGLMLSTLMGVGCSLLTTIILFQYDFNNGQNEFKNRHKRFDEIFTCVTNRANSNATFFSYPINPNKITPIANPSPG